MGAGIISGPCLFRLAAQCSDNFLSGVALSKFQVIGPHMQPPTAHVQPHIPRFAVGVQGLIVPLYNPTPFCRKSGPLPGEMWRHTGPALTIV
jgi:hypothetical protein